MTPNTPKSIRNIGNIGMHYNLLRHGVSAVMQAWYQIDQVLPDDCREARRAVSVALANLGDALFESEIRATERSMPKKAVSTSSTSSIMSSSSTVVVRSSGVGVGVGDSVLVPYDVEREENLRANGLIRESTPSTDDTSSKTECRK